MRFGMFVLAVGLCISTVQGQTVSLFKTLPGPHNAGSIMLVDASGVYSFGDTIRKYNLDGAEVWSRNHPRHETVAWLASTNAGVYAAGHISTAPAGIEAFVSLYDAQGNELWNRPIKFANARTINRSVAADETGVYVLGAADTDFGSSAYLRKHDPGGTEVWTKSLDRSIAGMTVDSSGIYVLLARSIRKYDRTGNELWVRTVEGSGQSYDMKANATGVYLTGYDNDKGYYLARYDSNGNQAWIRYGQSGWIALDANSIYVTAFTFRESGQCASGSSDNFVMRYNTDGNVLWMRQFGTYGEEYPQSIAADSTGVYVTGFGSGRAFLAKLEEAAVNSTTEPRIHNECVVNAASYVGGAVSPGEIVTIFGRAVGPALGVSASGDRTFETVLAETRVLFDGIPARLLYTSAEQVSVLVPNAISGKSSVGIQVEYRGVLSKAVTLPVLKVHPGIFSFDGSGSGQAAVLNEDGTPNSPANPARRGSIISIFATGGGQTNPATEDGSIAGNPPPRLTASTRVHFPVCCIDDETYEILAEVSYAGAVTGFVGGLVQVNARLPESSKVGDVSFALTVGDGEANSSQSVRISVKER